MYLYLGNEGVLVDELVVDVISFQKIFGLCGLKCLIVADGRTEDRARILKKSAQKLVKKYQQKIGGKISTKIGAKFSTKIGG